MSGLERTANAPVAQLDRVLASGAKGRGFKSRLAYHKPLDFTAFSVFVSKSVSKITKTEPLLRLCFLSPVIEVEHHADLRVPLHDPVMLIFPYGAHALRRLFGIVADEPDGLRVEHLAVLELLPSDALVNVAELLVLVLVSQGVLGVVLGRVQLVAHILDKALDLLHLTILLSDSGTASQSRSGPAGSHRRREAIASPAH